MLHFIANEASCNILIWDAGQTTPILTPGFQVALDSVAADSRLGERHNWEMKFTGI